MLSRSDSENIASNYFRPKRASQILSTDPMKRLSECPPTSRPPASSREPSRPSAHWEGRDGGMGSDRPGPQPFNGGETGKMKRGDGPAQGLARSRCSMHSLPFLLEEMCYLTHPPRLAGTSPPNTGQGLAWGHRPLVSDPLPQLPGHWLSPEPRGQTGSQEPNTFRNKN